MPARSGPFCAFPRSLREIYVNTGWAELAFLRCDLTMALHEADEEGRPAGKWDAAHKLIWCMDACQRDGQAAPRVERAILGATELQSPRHPRL